MSNNPGDFKSFAPVVGRMKSKRWVQNSNPSYEGDDWDDEYNDYYSEEEEQEEEGLPPLPDIPQQYLDESTNIQQRANEQVSSLKPTKSNASTSSTTKFVEEGVIKYSLHDNGETNNEDVADNERERPKDLRFSFIPPKGPSSNEPVPKLPQIVHPTQVEQVHPIENTDGLSAAGTVPTESHHSVDSHEEGEDEDDDIYELYARSDVGDDEEEEHREKEFHGFYPVVQEPASFHQPTKSVAESDDSELLSTNRMSADSSIHASKNEGRNDLEKSEVSEVKSISPVRAGRWRPIEESFLHPEPDLTVPESISEDLTSEAEKKMDDDNHPEPGLDRGETSGIFDSPNTEAKNQDRLEREILGTFMDEASPVRSQKDIALEPSPDAPSVDTEIQDLYHSDNNFLSHPTVHLDYSEKIEPLTTTKSRSPEPPEHVSLARPILFGDNKEENEQANGQKNEQENEQVTEQVTEQENELNGEEIEEEEEGEPEIVPGDKELDDADHEAEVLPLNQSQEKSSKDGRFQDFDSDFTTSGETSQNMDDEESDADDEIKSISTVSRKDSDKEKPSVSPTQNYKSMILPEIPPISMEKETAKEKETGKLLTPEHQTTVTDNQTRTTSRDYKYAKTPKFDIGAILAKPRPAERIAALEAARRNEHEYNPGLQHWLTQSSERHLSQGGDCKLFTNGQPPRPTENEARLAMPSKTVSTTFMRPAKHIASSAVIGKVGEKSSKTAKELFARGRKLMRPQPSSS